AHVVATFDRAVHWSPLAVLPRVGVAHSDCALVMDDADPLTVVITVSIQPDASAASAASDASTRRTATFLTTDGGRIWRPLDCEVYQIVIVDGLTRRGCSPPQATPLQRQW